MYLTWIDYIVFIGFSINILYLLIFSVASLRREGYRRYEITSRKRVVILIPAYKEDAVIMECVESCLKQEYPEEKYDIVVISDQMSDETNAMLASFRIKMIPVHLQNSTKAKALNLAMETIDEAYDVAVILDADNIIAPDFLTDINAIFNQDDTEIVQAHRVAKNVNNKLALLDAISEEINNTIFRQGHVNLGFSAALIGSGMAFKYALLKKELASIHAIGGFDRALELTLLKAKKKIDYLPHTHVWDEKIQNHNNFSRQRRRWISAQIHYLGEFYKDIPEAIRQKNWDFCDKIFQQMSIPRVLLLGLTFLIAIGFSVYQWEAAIKWWGLFILVNFIFYVAIPKEMITKKLLFATMILPFSFSLMLLNVFKIKGANKKFIHTSHGVK